MAAVDLPRKLSYVRMSDVRPAAANPRVHDLPSIKASISKLGFLDALIVDERTGRLIGGHGRVEALVQLRAEGAAPPSGIVLDDDAEWLVPVQRGWSSRSDTEAAAALVGHNRSTENARWNDYGLAELLEGVATEAPELLDAAGVDEEFIDDLLRKVNLDRIGEQDPDAPLPPAEDEKPIDPDAVLDDGSEAETLEEHQAKDDRPDNVCCPACGHIFPLKV